MRPVALSISALSVVLLAQPEAVRGPVVPAAAAAFSGDWQITAKTDSVTGRKVANILLQSSKTAHDGLYFAPKAVMQLGCLKGQPLIHLMFGFQIGSKADSEISYRFDDKPPREVDARILPGLKIAVIEDHAEVAQFFAELATANALYIVVSSLAKGRTSAEFHVSDAEPALDLISAVCPPKSKR